MISTVSLKLCMSFFKHYGGVCVCPHPGHLYAKEAATLPPWSLGKEKPCVLFVPSLGTRIMGLKSLCAF